MVPLSPPPEGIRRGTPAYTRANIALFLAGCATFSLLYSVQPLLPEFAREFRVGPGVASLALSFTTGALALSIFVAGAVGQALPRRWLMLGSMLLASLLQLVAGVAPDWPLLLGARLAEGFALGGVPAVAMAYLAEEMHPDDLGKAMGLYVSGTAFGGMMGRVGMGVLTEFGSWRIAMEAMGGFGLVAATGFGLLLPSSRRFVPQRGLDLGHHLAAWRGLLRQTALLRLFGVGFVLTSVFVALFNYAGFRLSAPPYSLGQSAISLIFLTYISGMFSSTAAGHLADHYGRRLPLAGGLGVMALGVVVTLAGPLWLVILGIALVTVGYFIAHSVASGWVGRLSGAAKGQAAALYLLFYYTGSSITGSLGGWFWQGWGWPGVVALTGGLALAGMIMALTMPGGGRRA